MSNIKFKKAEVCSFTQKDLDSYRIYNPGLGRLAKPGDVLLVLPNTKYFRTFWKNESNAEIGGKKVKLFGVLYHENGKYDIIEIDFSAISNARIVAEPDPTVVLDSKGNKRVRYTYTNLVKGGLVPELNSGETPNELIAFKCEEIVKGYSEFSYEQLYTDKEGKRPTSWWRSKKVGATLKGLNFATAPLMVRTKFTLNDNVIEKMKSEVANAMSGLGL